MSWKPCAVLFVSASNSCGVFIFVCLCLFVRVVLSCPEFCHHFPRGTNFPGPLFSHTPPLRSVSASLTSQGCCLCTVLLCHSRLVPLGLCGLIPLPFLGAEPVFSQGSFLWEPAQPLSLAGRHTPSPHTPNTTALKCENLKTKGPPVSFEPYCKASKSQKT